MKALILLSAGRHPVSGRARLPRVEAQAIGLARALGAAAAGLHAGPDSAGIRPALGMGLDLIHHVELPAGSDPAPALAATIARLAPDLVLAGNRAEGGDDTGLLPYRLASLLGWPIVADAAAMTVVDGIFAVDQALPKGVRRRIREAGPLVVTVHPAAPMPMPYAFGRERLGRVDTQAGPVASPAPNVEERPHKPRARVARTASTGGSAADRLKAATQMTAAAGGELMVGPDPETAARAILAHLRRLGAI